MQQKYNHVYHTKAMGYALAPPILHAEFRRMGGALAQPIGIDSILAYLIAGSIYAQDKPNIYDTFFTAFRRTNQEFK
jgi:hypothetical protein